MRTLLVLIIFLINVPLFGQQTKKEKKSGGMLSIGARSGYSLVNDGIWQKPAFGTGGQFRIQFSERVNSEWFIDYLTADMSYYAWRKDVHIGWSMMYYLTKRSNPTVQPYLLAGHCFEYLKLTDNDFASNNATRWSASVQGGIGTHLNITSRFDLSVTAQYMMHFGTKIFVTHAEDITTFIKKNGSGIHDHLLFHVSLNYKIADLW